MNPKDISDKIAALHSKADGALAMLQVPLPVETQVEQMKLCLKDLRDELKTIFELEPENKGVLWNHDQ